MEKYKIGDRVIYGINGVCEIIKIGPLDFGDAKKNYYSLKPVCDARSTIFVPVAKEDDIPRRVLSRDEVQLVIEAARTAEASELVINREKCDPVLKSGDNVEISRIIKQLRNMRKENRKNHKGLNIQEERILKDAEKVFFSEIASAFELSMEEVIGSYSAMLD